MSSLVKAFMKVPPFSCRMRSNSFLTMFSRSAATRESKRAWSWT
jgi:hypothetical protein